MLTAIEKITRKAARIKNGNDKIEPGQRVVVSEAISPGQHVRQGDLYLIYLEKLPAFDKVEQPNEMDRQLVPGNTQGAKHCLDSLDGVELFRPKGWSHRADYQGEWSEEMQVWLGPCMRITTQRTVTHPTHGDVVWFAGAIIQTGYQREFDAEQQRERRNAD